MKRDEPGQGSGDSGPGESDSGEWPVEGFDAFAPFDADPETPQESLDLTGEDEVEAPWLDDGALDSGDEPGSEASAPDHAGEVAADESLDDADPAETDSEDPSQPALELVSSDEGDAESLEDESGSPDFSAFTSREYVQATTAEHAGLAEEIARAAEENTDHMAVSAELPGIESGIVGLDDVVEAAGEHAEDIPERHRSDLPLRIVTALALLGLFVGSLWRPYLIAILIVLVLGLAAGELYVVLLRTGNHPVALFGMLGVLGALLGTWAWGPVAIPVSLALTAGVSLLFFATVPDRTAPLRDLSLTLLGTAWIGGIGGLVMDMVRSEHYGWLIAAIVVTVALMDVVQYFVGRRLGRRPLAPVVSPNKTIEGYVAGVLAALIVGAGIGYFEPFDLGRGLAIGGIVAIMAPLGDLAVSVLKRGLDVKDMGTVLPGHGGVLDRVDAMIFVMPVAWVAYAWMGLLA